MPPRPRLLINWVYYRAIGHTIEALRLARQFRNANPDLFIAVALHAQGGVELGRCLPWLDAVYGIDPSACAAPDTAGQALGAVPRDWDFCFTDPRHEAPMGDAALDACELAFRAHVRAPLANAGWHTPLGFPSSQRSPLRLHLPPEARRFAERLLPHEAPTRISLLLGSGAEASRTPPMPFWHALLRGLAHTFPGLEVVLLGSLRHDRSSTQGVTRAGLDALLAAHPFVRDAVDAGLLNQLALAERCRLHISPHTGMAFAIQCVGTPWLALSGADVAEYLANGVPFVSVYPDCPRYPCGPWFAPRKNPMLPECEARRAAREPFLCLDAPQLEQKLPQILQAARQLVRRELPYSQCARQHYEAMLPRLGRQPGDHFMEGFPDVLSEDFAFERCP
jgi:hypothetical protein